MNYLSSLSRQKNSHITFYCCLKFSGKINVGKKIKVKLRGKKGKHVLYEVVSLKKINHPMKTTQLKRLFSLGIFCCIMLTANSCMEKNENEQLAQAAYQAWQAGERTGNYTEFKALLSDNFNLFSHPSAVRGVYKEKKALEKMMELIKSREQVPNQLTFSNPLFMMGNDKVAVQFDSEGTVMNGQFPYKGYNIIVFYFEQNKISGFREYYGDVEPAWFKN